VGNTKCEIYVNKEKYPVISFVLELRIILHCRMDDIQDNSTLRRSIPAAHTIYGVASTTSAANCLILRGLKIAQSLNHPEAMKVCTERLLQMYWGQGLEIYWRDNYICPSFEEYKEMAKRSKDMVRAISRI
jgi:geranylgeranyl diphosphate synthase type 3